MYLLQGHVRRHLSYSSLKDLMCAICDPLPHSLDMYQLSKSSSTRTLQVFLAKNGIRSNSKRLILKIFLGEHAPIDPIHHPSLIPGHSQILSRSRGEKSGGLGSLLRTSQTRNSGLG